MSKPVTSVNTWSRKLGVSVRPWTGRSPLSLIVTGALRACIYVLLAVLLWRMNTDLAAMLKYDLSGAGLKSLLVVLTVGFVLLALEGFGRLTVGILDLVPRQTHIGSVISTSERKFADFLPIFVQRRIFDRQASGMDWRKSRTEVVLETPQGTKQWTIRKYEQARILQPGTQVRLRVTPITGYVEKIEQL